MNDVVSIHEGSAPLLVSVPHGGRVIPDDIRERMSDAGRAMPDTDWHVQALYAFATGIGASVIAARYSRYVVDLNRPASDEALYEGQLATGVCPQTSFAGDPLYRDGEGVTAAERAVRIDRYWAPYHDAIRERLDALRDQHGYALLWDAHSIPGEVPRLFDGELPVLNTGTFDERSCATELSAPVVAVAASSPYTSVHNGRFKGGFITRHFGQPADNVHAIQLEIAQRAYMDEATRQFDERKAADLRATLSQMLEVYLGAAAGHFA